MAPDVKLSRLGDLIKRLKRLDPDTPVATGVDGSVWMLMLEVSEHTGPLTEDDPAEAVNLGEAVRRRRA